MVPPPLCPQSSNSSFYKLWLPRRQEAPSQPRKTTCLPVLHPRPRLNLKLRPARRKRETPKQRQASLRTRFPLLLPHRRRRHTHAFEPWLRLPARRLLRCGKQHRGRRPRPRLRHAANRSLEPHPRRNHTTAQPLFPRRPFHRPYPARLPKTAASQPRYWRADEAQHGSQPQHHGSDGCGEQQQSEHEP